MYLPETSDEKTSTSCWGDSLPRQCLKCELELLNCLATGWNTELLLLKKRQVFVDDLSRQAMKVVSDAAWHTFERWLVKFHAFRDQGRANVSSFEGSENLKYSRCDACVGHATPNV